MKINNHNGRYALRDSDIRTSLIKHLFQTYSKDANTRILQEFPLCEGSVRIDIAVVNSLLIGYEIKSDSDTLERLPLQREIYSQVFNKITIVVGKQYSAKVEALIPPWWGIWQSDRSGQEIHFKTLRESADNPIINPFSLVKCLWRGEALAALRERGLADGLQRVRRSIIRERLANSVSSADLTTIVSNYLKARENWRIVLTPK